MTKKPPGRPTKNIIEPIPATPKQIAQAIFRAADKNITMKEIGPDHTA